MKYKPNEGTDVRRLSAKAGDPMLKGRIQETIDKAEENVTAHETFRRTDAPCDYCEHSALQCVPLQGQACFRCLCLLGHRIENSTALGNNYPKYRARMAAHANSEPSSSSRDTINKLKV